MIYELKHFDRTVLKFSAVEDQNDPEIRIIYTDKDSTFLPLDLETGDEGLFSWLKRRVIPSSRAYVNSFLSKCGLSLNRPFDIIRVSKGLSLNDCYWITEEGFEGTFGDYNLYDHRFSRILSDIAFTGCGNSVRPSFMSCPEFTTNGMLPKGWRRIKSKIYLFKGGTSGAQNTGMEPYSEFYASQIAEIMEFDAVPYSLSRWNGELCSKCELFTDKSRSYIPIGRIVRNGGLEAVEKFYEGLKGNFSDALNDMFVFDALIYNTDRHFGNFGVLVDNETNTITAPAPLFDHGNSLFNFAVRDDLESFENFSKYADSLLPCVYDDFVAQSKSRLTQKHRNNLRKLFNFRFKKHSRYNLPDKRLRFIEKMIAQRAQQLLA